ncbi:MAG: hypothetical protein QXD64_07480 [Thermoplasmata archaeon]
MSWKYIDKFGKVYYDATVEIESERYRERLEWRKRYIWMNFALSLFLFCWLLLISLSSNEKSMIVLPFIILCISSSWLFYLYKQDPRVKVILTEKGIFYGHEQILNYCFIPYDEIVAVEYIQVYLTECLRVVKKPIGPIKRGANIPVEDIKDKSIFLTKLKEKVPLAVFNI